MKLISMFNHKGGVSKTTTTFNLGWMLAEQGKKVLIVDADPQCNLTALVLGFNSAEDVEEIYASQPLCDIFSCVEPVIDGSMGQVRIPNPLETSKENLHLLCGNIHLSEIETQISVALTTSASIPAIRNIPGCIGEMLRAAGRHHEYDYVIVDMSPSVGALNQCLLMSSDYFIVPTSPDFFCAQAIQSLSKVVPRWNTEIGPFRGEAITYAFPNDPPKFIGFISQKYRPRNGGPARSFQNWIDRIKATVLECLYPKLYPIGMSISQDDFQENCRSDEPFNLANISDFNSLIAKSQDHNVPVFSLTDEQIGQTGHILENMRGNRDDFRNTFESLARDVVSLTS
ncbi:ParA family protein [Shewanella algae]|uniref:ParA family protein n=1 Tax=Shewanella algae TaxID=38313 RepID=UPI001AADB4BD|nr:AAA family ATPase [Shewanella algae]MBO2684976.1 AAA family ATPase [Shewanella algae]